MLKITKDNNPKLREKCKEVPLPLSKEDHDFLVDMMDYLHASQDEEFRAKHPSVREGVGLAAPQAGRNVRMLVISYFNPTESDPERVTEYALVNPRIIVNSVKKAYLEGGEGCLSVDAEHPGYVYRDFKIVVDAYNDLTGKQEKITARGYDAIVLQHEIDHLNGVLFYDHIDKKDPFKVIEGAVRV